MDLNEVAEKIVDTVTRQNWKNGGVLVVDRIDAIEYVAAQLALVQKGGEIIGVERLAKALDVPVPQTEDAALSA